MRQCGMAPNSATKTTYASCSQKGVYAFTGYNVLKESTGEELAASYACDSTSPDGLTPSPRPCGV